jgi:phenylpropionate dioxygenase-like ring-hydroxylating dioxygenase large terminal subunit
MTLLPENVKNSWHLVALSQNVKQGQVLSLKLVGSSIALFRSPTGLSGLIDRCPHRNYPLSLGRVVGNHLECPYHGWRFAGDGSCVQVPGCRLQDTRLEKLAAEAIQVREIAGGIFVCLDQNGPLEPHLPGLFGDNTLDHFWWEQGIWKGRALDAIENVMDPFHTNHLHHGFIRRRDQRLPVTLLVNSFDNGIEMVIEQTSPDLGLMSRFLEGDRARSRTRYYPPTIAQARWEGKSRLTLCVTAFFTPVDDNSFRPFACFTTPKGVVPNWLKQMAIRLFLDPVVTQDRKALETQHKTIQEFKAPSYRQGPGDILGARLQKLWSGQSIGVSSDPPFQAML